MGVWFQCEECIFASNSTKQASTHEATTGHTTQEEQD